MVFVLAAGLAIVTGATAFAYPLSPNDHMKPISTDVTINKRSIANSNEPSSNLEVSGFVGYVVKMEEGRMLVVSPEVTDFSSTGGQKNVYSAVWFSESPSHIEVGMKVEVWAKGGEVLESHPAQGIVERVSVLSDSQPEGTILSEAEAVKKAIFSLEIENSHFAVVKEVKYEPSDSTWTVYLVQDMRDKVVPIHVSDKY